MEYPDVVENERLREMIMVGYRVQRSMKRQVGSSELKGTGYYDNGGVKGTIYVCVLPTVDAKMALIYYTGLCSPSGFLLYARLQK